MFGLNQESFDGKKFNHLAYRDLRNSIIEDLWFGDIPKPNKVIYFLDEVAAAEWQLGGVKAGSKMEFLEYYCDLLTTIYKDREFVVTNEKRSMNIDSFIAQLKYTPGPYSFSDEVIAKALASLAEANFSF